MPVYISSAEAWQQWERPMEQVADQALVALGMPLAQVSVLLIDDAEIHSLNQTWRERDCPTDVLSFPQLAPDEVDASVPQLLGDVVISMETATRQAGEQGHSLAVELQVLLVHGLCHLLGHDHHDPSDAVHMQRAELMALAAVGGEEVLGLVSRVQGVVVPAKVG